MAELVDARDLKSLDGNVVWVRVPPPAPAFAREASEGCRAGARRAKAGCAARELRLGKPAGLHDLRCYILQSLQHLDRYYVGVTADLRARLTKHNAGEVSHTSKYAPKKRL